MNTVMPTNNVINLTLVNLYVSFDHVIVFNVTRQIIWCGQ